MAKKFWSEKEAPKKKKNRMLRLKGTVVKGFGRGSKELGIPTANMADDVVASLPNDFATGIYHAWAQVAGGRVYKAVMSVGWNPFYNNEKKSIEVHIIHKFEQDFYGQELRVLVTGYLRPEANFDGLDALIQAINKDIEDAKAALDTPELAGGVQDDIFQ
eukprot:m.147208 g.147208  ORF g.147208 m.147208 type:complete len:160 (+) comp20561_c4_seq4:554-1033(+)